MNYQTQAEFIEKAFMDAMDNNPEKSKREIISIVVEKGFPRASVRRVKGGLLLKLIQHAEILK